MRFVTTAAELNARDQIVMSQPAKRTLAFYLKAIETCDMMHATERARWIKELKESGAWKERFDSWDAASEILLEMTGSHSNKLIAAVSDGSAHKCAGVTDKETSKELKALKQVEKSRETPAKDEEEEKPAVHAATPEQMGKAPPKNADEWEKKEHFIQPPKQPSGKPSENGKPKHSLAIWRELSETHFGRALNRIDELNRQCPNPKLHTELIAADKRCITILEQWRQELK